MAEHEMEKKSKPGVPGKPSTELKKVKRSPKLIWIREKDWLSKITKKRWGTTHWRKHLEVTPVTLKSRARKGTTFNPDLIYKGDSFYVKS